MKNKKKEFDIYDIFLILAKHKKFIFFFTLLVSIIAVVYVLVVEEEWKAVTTFKTVDDSGSSLNLGASLLGFSAGMLGGDMSSMDHLITLNSKSFHNHIITKFNLEEYFDVHDPDPIIQRELAYELFLDRMYFVNINNESQLISIKILSRDRNLSAEIANYCRDYLDEYTKKNKLTKSKEKRIFIEQRALAIKDSILDLSNKIRKFQEENDITLLESQTEELIGAYSTILQNKVLLESDLLIQGKLYKDDNIQAKMLREKINFLDKQIDEFKNSDDSKYGISFKQLPELMQKYVLLKTQLEVYTKAYEYIYPQLEAARIDEIKDLDSIEVIDYATPEGMRAKPKRSKICILMFLAAFLFSSVLALYYDNLTESELEKIRKIGREILRFK